MTSLVPSAIMFINDDLTGDVRDFIIRQLYFDGYVDGYEFDAMVAADPNWPANIRQIGGRLLVIRDLSDYTNRSHADVVCFYKNGLLSTEYNKYGPPINDLRVVGLTWTDIGVFEHSYPQYNSFGMTQSNTAYYTTTVRTQQYAGLKSWQLPYPFPIRQV